MAKKTTKEAEIEAAAKEEVKAELQQAQEEAQQAQEEAGAEPADDFMNPPEDPKTGHLDAGQLAEWNKKELVDLAKDLEIKGAHDMSKEDLIAAIVAVEVEIPSEEEAGAEPEAAAGAEDPAADEAQDVEDFEVKKGDTVHLKAVMPIYDKIGGDQTGTPYKYNALLVEEVKKQGDRVYIKTEAGYIVAKDEANVYIM
jgi:hypothetical protein